MSAAPEGARPLAVFDIDGVLADVSHRLHFLDVHRWEKFFAAAHADLEGRGFVGKLVVTP